MARVRATHILPLLLLPVLCGCGSDAPSAPPPLTPAALEAVVEKPGIAREKLARTVDALFSAEGVGETRAVIVMRNGRTIAERYGPGYHENTRFISWSMAKTVTATMIGMLVADGRIRLGESAPVPAWQRSGDPRGEITLKQLLQMRSGLRHTEAGDPIYASDEVKMLFREGRDDMAAWAEAEPLEAEPGAKWEYSSNTTVILADIAARALTGDVGQDERDPETRRKAVSEYLRNRLWEPLGMRSMLPEFDANGTLIGGSLMHATARDWAKFGELLRNGGSVRGVQLVPRAWIDFMTTPNPRNRFYGAQTWLNRGEGVDKQYPGALPSVFSMNGHLGQYVVVSPRQGLTVVRLGNTRQDRLDAVQARIADILKLFPAR